MWVRSFALGIGAILLVACGSDADSVSGPPGVLMPGFERSKLGNGLTLLVLPDHSVPLVTATVVLHSGAFVEEEAQSGYSHLLEHMLLKANGLQPNPEELDDELRRRGILKNGLTGRDRVAYYYVMPGSELEEGLKLFAASLRSPQFDEASLQTEIDVVLAEYDRAEADPVNVQWRRASELLFPGHPNRVNALGRRDAIADATPEALQALYETYYVPNNACLILIGDVDTDDALELTTRYFGDWAKAPDPFRTQPLPEDPPLSKSSSDLLAGDVHLSQLTVAFHGPGTTRSFKDSVAADLLAQVTTLSDHVFRTLVSPPAIVGASFLHVASPQVGELRIELSVGTGHETEALDQLRWFDRFDEITPEQLDTARDQLWARYLRASDSSLDLSLQTANDWALGRLDPEHDRIATLYELEPADLQRFWSRYLADQHSVAVLLTSSDHVSTALEGRLKQAVSW
ncbi:MAG TPA: pitrilysin family protein [Polyangiales bacterium]|nr:pitrilysin family protein [Polyangiales bacterium]